MFETNEFEGSSSGRFPEITKENDMCDEARSRLYEEEHAWHIHNSESDIGYEAHLVQKEKDYQDMESQMRGYKQNSGNLPEKGEANG